MRNLIINRTFVIANAILLLFEIICLAAGYNVGQRRMASSAILIWIWSLAPVALVFISHWFVKWSVPTLIARGIGLTAVTVIAVHGLYGSLIGEVTEASGLRLLATPIYQWIWIVATIIVVVTIQAWRTRRYTRAVAAVCFSVSWGTCTCIAHDQPVHQRITLAAVENSTRFYPFLQEAFLFRSGTDKMIRFKYLSQYRTPGGWMAEGAAREDDGLRVINHFYNPINGEGLSDNSESPFNYIGNPDDSFKWVSGETKNHNSWQSARLSMYMGMIAPAKQDREYWLGAAFQNLGHVGHLLQDLSQPGHVRNDNHYKSSHRHIENYGASHINELDYNGPALDWLASGFDKVRDFWDRDLYNSSSSSALDGDSGSNRLGLAEFTNGNFLSEDTFYGEFIPPDRPQEGIYDHSFHYFKFPSLASTNWDPVRHGMPSTIRYNPSTVDKLGGRYVIVSKVSDGISVQNHSVFSLLGYKSTGFVEPPLPLLSLGLTLNCEPVLKEYHSILIPKAVSYSAGLYDYFFRGRLDVSATWTYDATSGSHYHLKITNGSSQTMSEGLLRVFRDDPQSVRRELEFHSDDWEDGETQLAAGESVTGDIYPDDNTPGATYTVVFYGSIGTTDPVDQSMALAVRQLHLVRVNLIWDKPCDLDLYLVSPDGSCVWWNEKVSAHAQLDHDNVGGTGPENITLTTPPDGDYKIWVNCYSNDKTPINGTLKVFCDVQGSNNSNGMNFTLSEPNSGAERPWETGGVSSKSWFSGPTLNFKSGRLVGIK